jgi:hypothetical protein
MLSVGPLFIILHPDAFLVYVAVTFAKNSLVFKRISATIPTLLPVRRILTRIQRDPPRLCARICARMIVFLFAIRGIAGFPKNRHFSLVKAFRFEMKSDALKSMISQS